MWMKYLKLNMLHKKKEVNIFYFLRHQRTEIEENDSPLLLSLLTSNVASSRTAKIHFVIINSLAKLNSDDIKLGAIIKSENHFSSPFISRHWM